MPDSAQKPIIELPPYEHIPEGDTEVVERREVESARARTAGEREAPLPTPPAPAAPTVGAEPILQDKSQMRRDIERILEEDLGDIYLTLNQKQRSQFRIEGEKTAAKIELILQQAKVKLMTLIKLIRSWLLLLPGVNRFFLEQEAKIKAEKLLILKTADE